MRDKAVKKTHGIPYAATTTLDARFSSVTYHRGKRNFGTGYDMMERIDALEAKLARAVEFIKDLEGHQWPLDVQAKRILAELKEHDNA